MSFDEKRCMLPSVYCGNGPLPRTSKDGTKYTKKGTPYQCLQKGFGAGKIQEELKNVSATSLRRIKYVTAEHEKAFQKEGIRNLNSLKTKIRGLSLEEIKKLFRKVLKKKGSTDNKAYNMCLLWLFQHGVSDLPSCVAIKG